MHAFPRTVIARIIDLNGSVVYQAVLPSTERKKIKPDIDSGVCIQEIRDEQTV